MRCFPTVQFLSFPFSVHLWVGGPVPAVLEFFYNGMATRHYAYWRSEPLRRLSFEFLKVQDGGRPPLWKSKTRRISEFGAMTHIDDLNLNNH